MSPAQLALNGGVPVIDQRFQGAGEARAGECGAAAESVAVIELAQEVCAP